MQDRDGSSVAGASVSGFITGPNGFVTNVQATTDSSGVAEIRQNVSRSGVYTFIVSDITDNTGIVSDITDNTGDSDYDPDSDIISSIQVEMVIRTDAPIPSTNIFFNRDAKARSLIDQGNELYSRGEYAAALSSYEDAIGTTTNPRLLAIAHQNKGLAHDALGDPDAAIEAFNQVIRIDPGFAIAYYYRATVYDAQGNARAAIEDFAEFLDLYTLDDAFSDYARQRIGP